MYCVLLLTVSRYSFSWCIARMDVLPELARKVCANLSVDSDVGRDDGTREAKRLLLATRPRDLRDGAKG